MAYYSSQKGARCPMKPMSWPQLQGTPITSFRASDIEFEAKDIQAYNLSPWTISLSE